MRIDVISLFPSMFQGGPWAENRNGRLALAESVFDRASDLAARVWVNRIWMGHFGAGLCATPDNLGVSGAAPSHPGLLDDLAGAFRRRGWSAKWLHREIMTSRTWRQSSDKLPRAHERDPDNRLLWRMNRRRLTIESWRDSILAACGRLDRTMGGRASSLSEVNNVRRTIYGEVHRRELDPVLRLHDFPDPNRYGGKRIATMTATQQLFTLNAPWLDACAWYLKANLPSLNPRRPEPWIVLLHQKVLGRDPFRSEIRILREFILAESAHGQSVDPAFSCARALLTCNELLYVD